MDNTPVIIERVLEVPPNASVQYVVGGQIMASLPVPQGHVRILVKIMSADAPVHKRPGQK